MVALVKGDVRDISRFEFGMRVRVRKGHQVYYEEQGEQPIYD